jgi:hypothetical protein
MHVRGFEQKLEFSAECAPLSDEDLKVMLKWEPHGAPGVKITRTSHIYQQALVSGHVLTGTICSLRECYTPWKFVTLFNTPYIVEWFGGSEWWTGRDVGESNVGIMKILSRPYAFIWGNPREASVRIVDGPAEIKTGHVQNTNRNFTAWAKLGGSHHSPYASITSDWCSRSIWCCTVKGRKWFDSYNGVFCSSDHVVTRRKATWFKLCVFVTMWNISQVFSTYLRFSRVELVFRLPQSTC